MKLSLALVKVVTPLVILQSTAICVVKVLLHLKIYDFSSQSFIASQHGSLCVY